MSDRVAALERLRVETSDVIGRLMRKEPIDLGEAIARVRVVVAEGDALGYHAAWLRWELAEILDWHGEYDDALMFAEEAVALDPLCLEFIDRRDRLAREAQERMVQPVRAVRHLQLV